MWHMANVAIQTPEWLYIQLRPRSLPDGNLSAPFAIFNLYATKDTLFLQHGDRAVKAIYAVGTLDVLFCLLLSTTLRPTASASGTGHATFAVLCLVRECVVATKTVIYLLYSWPFIERGWRVPITAMNTAWVVVPCLAVVSIGKAIGAVVQMANAADSL